MSELSGLRAEKLIRLYRANPEAYAHDVLGVKWWSKQVEIANALVEEQKVMVLACHSVGKTNLAGGLVNWHFDCYTPSITLTTAPTAAQVDDTLWKEVRSQRRGRAGLLPKSSRMELSPEHFAVGITASKSDAFQGRHEQHLGVIFDEAVGIDGPFWDAAEGMVTGDDCWWMAIMNPTDTASKAYEEYCSGEWKIIHINALHHPNILAELQGLPVPYPKAVRLSWVEQRIKRWCTPISAGDKTVHDVEWPPNSGTWYSPGPLFESRVLGRWPRQGSNSVWSEGLWDACLERQPVPRVPLMIGCDVARFGEDWTAIHVRRGPCSLHHERHNGWGIPQTAKRIKELCKEFAEKGEEPKRIECRIDDSGVGGGVTDIGTSDDYNFIGINSLNAALEIEDYPNARSEMWFNAAKKASERRIDVSRLDETTLNLLRADLMAPRWKQDSGGRRVVEIKDDMKKRIGRSPDDADAFNLCHYGGLGAALSWIDL